MPTSSIIASMLPSHRHTIIIRLGILVFRHMYVYRMPFFKEIQWLSIHAAITDDIALLLIASELPPSCPLRLPTSHVCLLLTTDVVINRVTRHAIITDT
jgi:hypothetical protein